MTQSSSRQVLVLWDVDKTLVDLGTVGEEIYRAAFEDVFGRPMAHTAPRAGRTDPAIALETMLLHGVAEPQAHLPRFLRTLARHLSAHAFRLARHGRVLPGAAAALAALQEVPGVVQSVLTGNIRENAITKLRCFGLAEFLDLEVGAYGSDGAHRPALVALARRRAEEKYGFACARANTVLVGDTPHDVKAGVLGGARVVAVATGPFSMAELASADHSAVVLPDLRDTEAVVRAVLSP